jgi:hypothetical protein
MIPIFLHELPTDVNLNKPQIEFVTYSTVLEDGKMNDMKYILNYFSSDLWNYNYTSQIGTTLTSSSKKGPWSMPEENRSFYSDDYDISVKLNLSNTINRKMRVKTISKYKPKIVL